MKNNYITYLELLEMIRDDKAPDKVKLHLLFDKAVIYKKVYDGEDFNYYEIDNKLEQDSNYNFYLRDCLLDSQSFDKCIEITDYLEDKENKDGR